MNNQQQSQDQDAGYVDVPYGIPQMPRSDRADMLDKINPNTTIEKVRHLLMGEELIDGVYTPIPELSGSSLTKKGAYQISNLLHGASANMNISMSKFDAFQIANRVKAICRTAQIMCVVNWAEYGITDSSQLWYVNQIMFSNTFAVFNHALDAGFQEMVKGTVQENRLIQSTPKQPGRVKRLVQGFFG